MHPVDLPAGFPLADAWQRRVWLRAWCGDDLDFLAGQARYALTPARLTTTILGRCLCADQEGSPLGEEQARQLCVGDREALLLHLLRITQGERLDCAVACPACGERLDLELRVGDLLVPPYDSPRAVHTATIAGESRSFLVEFRLPTGTDQELAADLAATDLDRAVHALLERCVRSIDGTRPERIPREVQARLPAFMAELDPQAELVLNASCPACSSEVSVRFDSAAFVYEELERAIARLYREVHTLALYYHWREADILEMSEAKRARYLRLIDEFVSGGSA